MAEKLTIKYEDYLHPRLAADPAYAAEYLNACLADEDPHTLLVGLRDVAQAYGAIWPPAAADQRRLKRETLEQLLAEPENPAIRNLATVLDALGFALRISPKVA